MKLYSYFRSSAAFRVRIALNLKGIRPEYEYVSLIDGEQRANSYMAKNPTGLVPLLETADGKLLSQSLAIIEYLEEEFPEPRLLPEEPLLRAKARAIALTIASEIHPLNNLRVLQYLKSEIGLSEDNKNKWYQHWITEGFQAIERMLSETAGEFSIGDSISIADIFLVPQVFNARRFNCPLDAFPLITRISDECMKIAAFVDAAPHNQPDSRDN